MAKQKKRSNKVIWILLIVVVLVLVGAIAAKNAIVIGGPKTLKVKLVEAKRTTIIEKVTASGVECKPVTEIAISPDVAGEIIELNVEEGDDVQAGMVLVKIRPDNLQKALDRSNASARS